MAVLKGKLVTVLLTILAVLFLQAQQVPAEIYRWVDEDGVTHFSDKKPTGENEGKAETIDPTRSGSLSVIEGGDIQAPSSPYSEDAFVPVEKPGINRNASVVIYTTAT